jgi:hypothetical protein
MIHRRPKKLYNARNAAVTNLQRAVDARKKKLAPTIRFELPKEKIAKKKPAKAKRK